MRPRMLVAAAIAVILSTSAACSAAPGGQNEVKPGNADNPTPESSVGPAEQQAVVAAKKDLSRRTGKPVEQLSLVSVEEVEWRDSSLGCPEPGKFYAQVITPGYRVILSDGMTQFQYHSDTRGHVVLCERRS